MIIFDIGTAISTVCVAGLVTAVLVTAVLVIGFNKLISHMLKHIFK